MIALMSLCGAGLWSNLRYSNPTPEHSLTAYNASSPQNTLGIMLVIALIGVPIVIAYTISIYWIFRGKVQREHLVYYASKWPSKRCCSQLEERKN